MSVRLVVLSGLPGTGKTTLARLLARRLRAAHLRIDTIEDALAGSLAEVGTLGYGVALALAADNLSLGLPVVADAVNPVEAARAAWREVGRKAGAATEEVEILCSDADEHRRRVEARLVDGRLRPTWDDVSVRAYEPWATRPIRIDTAGRTAEGCLADLLRAIAGDA